MSTSQGTIGIGSIFSGSSSLEVTYLEQKFLNKKDKMASFVKKCETKKEESECLVKKKVSCLKKK